MRTPSGGARIPATPTRTGVFRYVLPDGSARRELRHPDEVFKADSLRTLDTAAVTIGHPGMVTPQNWRSLSVGDMRDSRPSGKLVASEAHVRDGTALARVDSGELVELSCGYACDLEMSSGTFDGEEYDAIQRNIKYNHVALLPDGAGRAGPLARLHVDGADEVGVEDSSDETRKNPGHYTPGMSDEAKDLKVRLDAATTDLVAVRAENEKLRGERDQLKSELDKSRKDAADATKSASQERIDARVKERMTVIDGARLLAGKEIDLAKSDRDLMVASIVARDEKFDAKDRSDEYIRARFDMAVESARNAGEKLGNLNAGTKVPQSVNEDGEDELALAQKNFKKNNTDAHDAWLKGNN